MAGQSYPHVFQPISIGSMKVKNRVAMAPMASNTADENGFVTQQGIDYYEARARGGVGLIIMEVNCIKVPQGRSGPRRYNIDDDKYISGLSKLAEAVHKHGAKLVVQLQHSGAQSISRSVNGEAPVTPSVAQVGGADTRALTVGEVHELTEAWGKAAARAKKAGVDGVEIHGATNYLLAEFQSSFWNKRTDEYGGDIKNRGRFLVEVLQAVKASVGSDFAFWPRVNLREYGPNAGVTEEEGKTLAQMVEATGAWAIDVTAFGGGPYGRVPPMGVPKGNMIELAGTIKKMVKIPVLVAGRVDPENGEKAIAEGKTDMISVARSMLADPDLPRKYAEGHPEDVVPCIACGFCNDSIRLKTSVQCMVNPALGFEKELAITPAPQPRKVLVIGGGPAGMEAARVAALRGHKVTLYEKEKKLGGQLNLAIIPPFKEPIVDLLHHLTAQMKKNSIKVELGKAATAEAIKKLKPDAVIVAAGAEPFNPNIPARDSKPVVQAPDVLAGKAETGEKVVIVGGELVGCETAEHLADQGKKVTVVRRGAEMATKVRPAARTLLLERLNKKGVALVPGVSSYDQINKEGLVLTKDGKSQTIAADTIVIAAGSKPSAELLDSVKKASPNAIVVGDMVEPRDIQSAVNDGYRAALKI